MERTVLLARESRVSCEVAGSAMTRMRGLLGRRGLPRGHGLFIEPTWSVHTWFMRFPIDVVFLDRDLTVLELRTHLKPWRMAARFRARSVLELASGECDRLRLEVGDRLAFEQ
jgi:uncharacterized protein